MPKTKPKYSELEERIRRLEQELEKKKLAEKELRERDEYFSQLSENIIEAFWLGAADNSNRIIYMSPAFEEIWGVKRGEVQDYHQFWLDSLHKEDKTGVVQALDKFIEGGGEYNVRYRIERPDRTVRWIRARGFRVRDRQGNFRRVAGIAQDITEQRLAEQALETESYRLREYFENLPLMAYNINADGSILDCNNLVLQALGYAGKDELIGKPLLTTIYHPDCRDKAGRLFRQWKEKGKVINQELKVITKKGEPLDVLLNADTIYDSSGEALYSISTHLDITERKHTEESLKESEEKYRLISENIPVAVYSALPDKHSTSLFISGNIEELTGYSGKEFLRNPELWDMIIHPEDRQIVREKILEHRRKRIPLETEYRIITKANDLRWLRDKATPLLDKRGRIGRINGFMEDITERKLAEEKLHEYKRAVESSREMIAAVDRDYFYLFANDAFLNYRKMTRNQVIGKKVSEILGEELFNTQIKKHLDRCFKGRSVQYEMTHQYPDIGETTIEVSYFPLMGEAKKIKGAVAHIKDITGRKLAEQQLQASLREKELMLQELYHRVKNNLQVVFSLLNLKSKNVRGKKAAAVLEDCKHFVGAMASVHERLYRDKDLGKINFKEFITEITTELVHAFHSGEPDKVALKFDLENVFLGIDSAVPCGLLINELVTNSLRHAFPGGRKGEIEISLNRRKKNEIELSVSDSGIGLPGELDYRNTKSFGLYLVRGLAEKQLQGRIESTGGRSGTGFRIVFQQDGSRKRGKG